MKKYLLYILFPISAFAAGVSTPPAIPASQVEVNSGTVSGKYVSPATLSGFNLKNPTNGITAINATNIVKGMLTNGNPIVIPANTDGSGLINITASSVAAGASGGFFPNQSNTMYVSEIYGNDSTCLFGDPTKPSQTLSNAVERLQRTSSNSVVVLNRGETYRINRAPIYITNSLSIIGNDSLIITTNWNASVGMIYQNANGGFLSVTDVTIATTNNVVQNKQGFPFNLDVSASGSYFRNVKMLGTIDGIFLGGVRTNGTYDFYYNGDCLGGYDLFINGAAIANKTNVSGTIADSHWICDYKLLDVWGGTNTYKNPDSICRPIRIGSGNWIIKNMFVEAYGKTADTIPIATSYASQFTNDCELSIINCSLTGTNGGLVMTNVYAMGKANINIYGTPCDQATIFTSGQGATISYPTISTITNINAFYIVATNSPSSGNALRYNGTSFYWGN